MAEVPTWWRLPRKLLETTWEQLGNGDKETSELEKDLRIQKDQQVSYIALMNF